MNPFPPPKVFLRRSSQRRRCRPERESTLRRSSKLWPRLEAATPPASNRQWPIRRCQNRHKRSEFSFDFVLPSSFLPGSAAHPCLLAPELSRSRKTGRRGRAALPGNVLRRIEQRPLRRLSPFGARLAIRPFLFQHRGYRLQKLLGRVRLRKEG